MCYKGNDKKMQRCKSKRIDKSYLSTDFFLKLKKMKLESLVIIDKFAMVNKYPNLVQTAHHVTKASGLGRFNDAYIKE